MLVNGSEFSLGQLAAPEPLALIDHFQLDPRSVAVERNGQIVPRSEWPGLRLADDDRIELIRFVGGG